MVQVNYDSAGKEKVVGTILVVVAALILIFSVIMIFGGEFEGGVIFVIIGVIMLAIGCFKRKIAKNVDQYLNLLNGGYTSINELVEKTHKPEGEVIEDIVQLIKKGMFLNIYYDKESKSIKNIISNSKNEEKEVAKIQKCPGCGANVDISKSKYCEFCGRKLI